MLHKLLLSALLFLTMGMLCACQPVPTTGLPPICVPSETTIDEASGYPEIEIPASEGTLWALLYAQEGQFRAHIRARIVWKMTDGRGDIRLVAISEDGTRIAPAYGPISRAVTRAWKHDGQEWGSEFAFPEPGCWRIEVSRQLLDTDRPVTGGIAIQVKP